MMVSLTMLLFGMCGWWVTDAAAQNFQYFDNTTTSFNNWRAYYGVAYDGFLETARRFTTWSLNLQRVAAHNARADRGEVSFRLTMNRFADLTNEE